MTKQREKGDSRKERVKSHLSDGYYDRHDIVEATAGAVMKSKDIQIILDRCEAEDSKVKLAKTAKLNIKLAEVKHKIDDGYYDDPNNLAELAEKLIKIFGIE